MNPDNPNSHPQLCTNPVFTYLIVTHTLSVVFRTQLLIGSVPLHLLFRVTMY